MPTIEPHLDDTLPTPNPVSPPSPRSALFFDGTDWRVARVSATGYLEIDVLASALPAGAATAANQALALAQLQLIEDMRDALQSVATDRLIVRGEDQLFSIKGIIHENQAKVADANAARRLDSTPVPADEIWVITNIFMNDVESVVAKMEITIRSNGVNWNLDRALAVPADNGFSWQGHAYLEATDYIECYFRDVTLNDNYQMTVVGYKMTLET